MMRAIFAEQFSWGRNVRHAICFCVVAATSLAVLADPPIDPLPAPAYSFDLASPSVEDGIVVASDILRLDFPHPATLLSGETLGLWSALDDLDALSASNAEIAYEDVFALLFSVDRETTGMADPDPDLVEGGVPYNAKDQAQRRHAAGDRFYSTEYFTRTGIINQAKQDARRNNYLCRNNFDEGGTDFSAYPATHADTIVNVGEPLDAVDATARLVKPEQSGLSRQVYFSLTAQSPSLTTLPGWNNPSGAHVFCVDEPGREYGACCFGGWDCEILSEQHCVEGGGQWLGADTACDACNTLLGTGACCLFFGGCTTTTEIDCWMHWGSWYGAGSSCEVCDSPLSSVGACILWDSTCLMLDAPACRRVLGFWQGPGSSCDVVDLPPEETGGCCFEDKVCRILDESSCWDRHGVWLGPGVSCQICPAPPFEEGACCFDDGDCAILKEYECHERHGAWHGPQASCDACDVKLGGSRLSLFASFADLGLTQADDIDALIVFDMDENGSFNGDDQVLFSLAPTSPSLLTISGAGDSGAAADVFTVRPGQAPSLFAMSFDLGLGAARDNIDALEFHRQSATYHVKAPHGIRAPQLNDKLHQPTENQTVIPGGKFLRHGDLTKHKKP